MSKKTLLTRVEQHPRLIGFLFTMGVVLSQVGAAAANHSGMTNGP